MAHRTILITRPSYDYTTRYLSAWAEKVKESAESRGDDVLDLDGPRATKKELESILRKKNPSFIFLNGHGSDGLISGQNDEVLVQAGHNEGTLRSSIVYALSCKSGKELGPQAVEKGAVAYVGYEEDFVFMITTEKRTRPSEDRTAGLFLDPSNQVAISLLKGNTVEESNRKSKAFFIRNIQKLLTSQSPSEETAAVRYLYWDMKYQTFHGEGNAVI